MPACNRIASNGMRSADPEFETKAADMIGLYLDPPQHAVVFCIDEKTAMKTAISTRRHCVCNRRENADAVVADGHALVGRLAGNREGVPTEREGRRVRQVVSRIREQCEAVGEPATHRFDDDKRERQRDSGFYRSARHVRSHVRVTMGMLMWWT